MSITTKRYVGIDPKETEASKARAAEIAELFCSFIRTASKSLDIAIYHFQLEPAEEKPVLDAIGEAVGKGVKVRVAYYDEKKRGQGYRSKTQVGGDPLGDSRHQALADAGAEVRPIFGDLPSGVSVEPIEGSNLMHSKYMVRDGSAVWTGSGNFTTESWSVQDNNFVIFEDSESLAGYYSSDFNDLWDNGSIVKSGKDDHATVSIGGTQVDVDFSPGDGVQIEKTLSDLIGSATESIHVASMIVSSAQIMDAMLNAPGDVNLLGIYDEGQMDNVEGDWNRAIEKSGSQKSEENLSKWNQLKSRLVSKKSNRYHEGANTTDLNFMHDKLVVIDRKVVLTGSFNFSDNAARNAENVVTVHDEKTASDYADYVESLVKTYSQAGEADK